MIIDTMALGPHDGTQHRWALVISDISEAEGARLEAQAASLKMGTGADAVMIFTGCRVQVGGGEPEEEQPPIRLQFAAEEHLRDLFRRLITQAH